MSREINMKRIRILILIEKLHYKPIIMHWELNLAPILFLMETLQIIIICPCLLPVRINQII
ncbi:hypothetical protein CS542_10330 [Pedobacter sp. IW39]|nr:hypothetical protein CS542_10330 [Pedobacter sp. IW39]